jgi:hypothetical protein
MKASRHQGFILAAEICVSVDRGTTGMGAVISFFEAEIFHAPRCAAQFVVLARQA